MLADRLGAPSAQASPRRPGDGPGRWSKTSEGRPGSLRELAVRSAGYLAGREAVGMAVRLAGAVVTMRAIGPSSYGIFSAAAAFMGFATAAAQMGIEVFLIRSPDAPSARRYHEAFTFLLVTSTVVTVLALALTVPLGGLLRPTGVLTPLRVLLLLIPINVLWAPAQACIEREFGYRRMGILEVGGDLVLYATAVPLAVGGLGAWSLVAGYFAWQIWLLVGSLAFSGLRPRLAWSSGSAREMLHHGFSYSLTTWANTANTVVIALVVGTFAGAAGVGYVNFARRLIAMLNFTKRGVFRVGMVAVSRAHNGGGRLAQALDEGMFLVMIAAAAPFAAFGLVARWVVPAVFGRSWQPAVPLYVVLSIVSVLGVIMLVQCTVLFAVGKNMQVARASLINLAVLAAASAILVPLRGTMGLAMAVGVALVATVSSHRSCSRVAPIHYRRLLLPLAALVPPMLAPLFAFPWSVLTVAPAALALALPATRRELRFLVGVAQTLVRRQSTSDGAGEPAALRVAPVLGDPHPAGDTASPAPGSDGTGGRPSRAGEAVAAGPPPATEGMLVRRMSLSARPVRHDPLEGLRVVPPGAVAGAPNLEVMLARAGRLLGAARSSGWPLMLAVFELSAPSTSPISDATLRAVTDALREDLRFDDPVGRVPPATFVVATALVPGGSDGDEVAARLAASVEAALSAAQGAAPSLRWSADVTTATSAEEVDELLRRVVADLQSAAVPEVVHG